MIILGADHGGYHLKEDLIAIFQERKMSFLDLSSSKFDSKDDYPPIAFQVGQEVVAREARGILICGSGIGISIAANKVSGVRAAPLRSLTEVILARLHNDINILCLHGLEFDSSLKDRLIHGDYQDLLSLQPRKVLGKEVWPMVEAFLTTPFEGERHKRRVGLIQDFEKSLKP